MPSAMARQRDDERVASARMGIGGQLLLLLAIPLTALLLVTGYGVRSGATQAQAASELTERTDVALAAYALVEDLQAERSELIRNDATTRPMRLEVESSQAALEQAAARAGGDLETRTNDALRRVGAASSVAGMSRFSESPNSYCFDAESASTPVARCGVSWLPKLDLPVAESRCLSVR